MANEVIIAKKCQDLAKCTRFTTEKQEKVLASRKSTITSRCGISGTIPLQRRFGRLRDNWRQVIYHRFAVDNMN